ncbi:DNA-binding transcriptional ArsR family regulator [Mucilaginibacter sp. SG538B]|jgi:DNA-binding transcriptional ArsR family regulator|uniref:ArsR/SmtB family transcription factor n=1 Tax=Mucilaginibacter sp. SG538B TaxID=2587021 RepID=UPI00159D60CA|nr:metalloregulator ArsR/SmtB family transcription factor [Mucilaginibacter sp. SG538B]NVM67509.1 DNA-binding transcriptional ArsR family regulator [Mucilaginibacter sp. SG538B]
MRRDVFQAIADPTRRAIISLLALQAMTPNAIAEHFQSSRQAVSKHIQILSECQLVNQKQTGREIYYHFNVQKMKEVDVWMDQFRALWETRFSQLDNVLQNLKNKQS